MSDVRDDDGDDRWSRSTDFHAGKLKGLVDRVVEADNRGECEALDPEQF